MPDMSDPTLRILASLDNPDRYVREVGVPVFVPHVRRDEDGEVEASVSPEDLASIAEGMQQKLEEYGALVRVTRGHVKLAKPGEPPPDESEQPPIMGWAKNARVGKWGPGGDKLGLLVDIYFDKKAHAEAMGYPFRSAEYYPETGEITGIALLRRDPELDLGVLTYARQGTPERGTPEGADMPTEDDLDELLNGDDQEQYADDDLDFEGDMANALRGEPDGDEFSPEESEQYARMCRYMHQHASEMLDGMGEDDEDRPHVEQMARAYGRMAYAGEPGGGNSFVPGTEDLDLDEPPMDPIGAEDDMEQYALKGDNKKGQMKAIQAKDPGGKPKKAEKRPGQGKYYGRQEQPAHYARQMQQLEAQVQELRRDRELLKYERQLLRLEQAGVEFDMQQELADAATLTTEQRARHLKKMARHYARSVTSGGLIPTDLDDVESPRQRPMTAAQRKAATAYVEKTGCTWDQAMAQVMSRGI